MTATEPPRRRLVEWEDPAALRAAFQRAGGLAMIKGIANGTLPSAPMTALLELTLVEVEEGRTVWSAEPGEEHQNEIGLVHGGLASSLLDTALGTTMVSTLAPGDRAAGLNLVVHFLRPLTANTGRVRCEGRIVQMGSRVAHAEAELTSEETGELLARATSTFSLVREEREGS
jgi:uncharacterized protein (TIGR00369 family)